MNAEMPTSAGQTGVVPFKDLAEISETRASGSRQGLTASSRREFNSLPLPCMVLFDGV